MNIWNRKNLPIPPINTYKAANENIDIKHMYDVLREGKLFFDDNKYMYAEYLVLSRIVYRMKQKFRTAKDFKALEKVNKALDNYFKMNVSISLKKFMDLIPFRYKEETYLPTKNLLDYILVRLQGLAKLMERIVETSKIAAYLLDKRIHTGHFWKIGFIIFALVSRLYVLAKYTTKFICEYYHKLLPFSHQLKNTGRDWLPENYILPDDLKEWIDVDWLEIDDDVQIIEVSSEIPDIIQFFDLVNDDDDDIQFSDEYFLVDDEDDVEIVKEFKKIYNTKAKNSYVGNVGELRGFDNREDIGEVIEINDSLIDENSFSPNVRDVTDISVISIISDTDKSDVINIADSTFQSELEESSMLNSFIDFGRDLVSEGNVLPVSDISLVEITDEDDSKIGSSNNNSVGNKPTSVLISNSNLNTHISNSLLVSDSECELAVAEGENNNTVSHACLEEIKVAKEVGTKKSNKNVSNGDKLENNLKLPQMETSSIGTNIKSNPLSKSGSDSGNATIKSDKENIVILSDTSVIEVTDDKMVKKKNLLKRRDNRNGKPKNKNGILSPESGDFVIESDDVIIISDTSILKAPEDSVLKKKKVKRQMKKGDQLLKKVRSKRKVNSPLILNPVHFNTNMITKSSEKSIATSTDTVLRDDIVIKKKKKKLKQTISNGNALKNMLVRNNAPLLISNRDNIVSKRGEKNDMSLIELEHNKEIKKKKNKFKQTKSVGNLEICSQFENAIKPHCSSIVASNLEDGDRFKKNVKVTDNNVSKRKRNKLSKNGNNNNKLNKKFKLMNNDAIVEGDESIRNGSTKMKINKFKKATENVTKLEDKLSKNQSKKMEINTDISQDYKDNKYLTEKHKENVTLDSSVMKIVSKKLKKKMKTGENNQNSFRNTTTSSLSKVVQDDNKQRKGSAENLVINLNRTGSSNKLTKIRDREKSTHKISSNLQNKIKKKQIRNNYENHTVKHILSATTFDINSRKIKINKHLENEKESISSNKRHGKNRDKPRTQLLAEVSSQQEVKAESNAVNVRKSNKKKKRKLKLLNKLTQAHLQDFQKSPKFIDKIKRSLSSTSEKFQINKNKRKNAGIL